MHWYNFQHVHRSIGTTLALASNQANEDTLWTRQYGCVQPNISGTLRVGEFVRIARTKGLFEKGSIQNWSTEPFEVTEVKIGHPVMYKVKDLLDEPIRGSFYVAELQFISKTRPIEFLVEKILKTRKHNGVE
jgi:hypothetical protein